MISQTRTAVLFIICAFAGTVSAFLVGGYIPLLCIGVPALVGLWSDVREGSRRRHRLGEWPTMSDNDFFERYFLADGFPREVVLGLREDIAQAFDVDRLKIHPDLNLIDDMDPGEIAIITMTEERFDDAVDLSVGRMGRWPDKSVHITTVRDYIHAFCQTHSVLSIQQTS